MEKGHLERCQRGDLDTTPWTDTALRDIQALPERGVLIKDEGGGRNAIVIELPGEELT